MERINDVLGLASFICLFAYCWATLRDFARAVKVDGNPISPILRCKELVWASFCLVCVWAGIGRLEDIMDFWPGVSVRHYASDFVWLPNGLAAFALFRLQRTLNRVLGEKGGRS